MGERRTLRDRLNQLGPEAARFAAVGAFGFLVNAAVFNLCIHTLNLATIRSSVIATALAIVVTYLGNRHWTYRHRDKSRFRREATLFLLFSGSGMVIESGILAISHYGLDFTSPLADNIAKYVFGLSIGSFFRFWSYRTWVFRAVPGAAPDAGPDEAEAPGGVRADEVRDGGEEDAEVAGAPWGAAGGAEPPVRPGQPAGLPAPARAREVGEPGTATTPAARSGQPGPLLDTAGSPGVLRLAAQKEGEHRRSLL